MSWKASLFSSCSSSLNSVLTCQFTPALDGAYRPQIRTCRIHGALRSVFALLLAACLPWRSIGSSGGQTNWCIKQEPRAGCLIIRDQRLMFCCGRYSHSRWHCRRLIEVEGSLSYTVICWLSFRGIQRPATLYFSRKVLGHRLW